MLGPNRWSSVERLYHAALGRPEGTRAAFLFEACAGDDELRREVESLLAQPASAALASGGAIEAAAPLVTTPAPAAPGTRLGAYQIVGPLGTGGMGEVYRARDTRLGREVAIKILPAAFTSDADRLARFEREARVLAALNHPHIGAIYGIEDAPTASGTAVRALVLELVEGATLAERIGRSKGGLPVKEASAMARQIADALDAAHEKGIVHRDLKPANIKVTSDGTVKVLDFGLAKLASHAGDTDMTESPTLTVGGTREGVVVGTAAYMSPEQARGAPMDKRTDIWAFGCVLYEMLTGRAAFARGTISDTLVAILDREPDWQAMPPIPPRLSALIRHCLQKDPKLRLRDIGDARNELGDERGLAESSVAAAFTGRPRSAAIPWLITGLAVAALLTLLIAPRFATRDTRETSQISRTAIVLPDAQQLQRSAGSYPLTLSRDGTRLVYVAESEGTTQLYMRDLAELAPTSMPGTKGASNPFFSPDGMWVAFFAGGMLQKAAVAGGTPVQICPVGGTLVNGAWSRDGTIVFAVRGSGLFTVSDAGGTPRLIPDSRGADWPDVLPDGKTVLVTWGGSGIVAMSFDGSNRRVVAVRSDDYVDPNASAPWLQQAKATAPRVLGAGYLLQARYVPTGHVVYGQSPGVVRAVAFDAATATIRAASLSLIDSVYEAPGAGAVYFSISDTGLLTYSTENRQRQLVWVDREGHATPLAESHEAFRQPRLSPDGTRVAVAIDSEIRRSDIWIYDTQRGARTRLTNDEHNLSPLWTRDGTRIFFYRNGKLAVQPVDRLGGTFIVHPGPDDAPSSWAPDGRRMLFIATDPKTGGDVWELSFDPDPSARPLLVKPSSSEVTAKFSPDGRLVAYVSNASGRFEVYLASYPDLEDKVAVSAGGGVAPVWSPTGRELFYREGPAIVAVQVRADAASRFQVSTPQVLFSDSSYMGVGGDLSFDVAPDGRRFLMVKGSGASDSQQIVVVHNWFEDLKRRASSASDLR
jgi:eukaryotic-like serine/threonine-protein kinase